jgi:hypothetical protein
MIRDMVRAAREPTFRMAWLRLHIELWHLMSEIGWAIRNFGADMIDWVEDASRDVINAYAIEEEDLHKVVHLDDRRP